MPITFHPCFFWRRGPLNGIERVPGASRIHPQAALWWRTTSMTDSCRHTVAWAQASVAVHGPAATDTTCCKVHSLASLECTLIKLLSAIL